MKHTTNNTADSSLRWYHSALENIRKSDPSMAEAMSSVYDHVTDRWHDTFPTKEQTDKVNRYLSKAYCGWDDSLSAYRKENMIAHREIAVRKVLINLISFLDRDLLTEAEKTLLGIARDPEYHLLENRTNIKR